MPNLKEWIKDVSMTDVGTLVSQALWSIGSLTFTGVAAILMLSESDSHAESHYSTGYNLALALLFAWTGKSAIGGFSHWGNRTTSREYMDKKVEVEKARATKAPPMVDAPGGNVALTGERPAVTVERPAQTAGYAPVASGTTERGVWTPSKPVDETKRPATETDIWTDDERGESDPNPPNFLLAGTDGPHNYNRLREPRLGIMLHYDGSTTDRGAQQWLLRDPRCHVSYNWLALDAGSVVAIAPAGSRAWHAGVCHPSSSKYAYKDANSAFYGLAFSATQGDVATEAAKVAVARHCLGLFRHHGWDPETDGWRIVGHGSEAWPRGRKVDPEGHPGQPGYPFLRVDEIRQRVALLATSPVV